MMESADIDGGSMVCFRLLSEAMSSLVMGYVPFMGSWKLISYGLLSITSTMDYSSGPTLSIENR